RTFPAGVGSVSRPSRSTSFSPSDSSSARICSLTVGCERLTASAALVKLCKSITLQKTTSRWISIPPPLGSLRLDGQILPLFLLPKVFLYLFQLQNFFFPLAGQLAG